MKKGQILLRIDPTDYQRDVARMEAEIAQLREAVDFSADQLARSEKAQGRGDRARRRSWIRSRHEAALARARLKAAEVALATARDRLRYTEIEAPFDGTVIQRNVQPGEVVVPGMTATFEGKAAAGAGRHVGAAGEDRPEPDRRGPGEAGAEGGGDAGRPAGQEVHGDGHPGGARRRSPGQRARTPSRSRRR